MDEFKWWGEKNVTKVNEYMMKGKLVILWNVTNWFAAEKHTK